METPGSKAVQERRKISEHPCGQIKKQFFYSGAAEKDQKHQKKQARKKALEDPEGTVRNVKQGLGKDHDDPQINGAGGNGLPVFLFRFQAEEDGHHAHGKVDQILKYMAGCIVHE